MNLFWSCLISASLLYLVISEDHYDELCSGGPFAGENPPLTCKTLGYSVSQLILKEHNFWRSQALEEDNPEKPFKWSAQLSEEVQTFINNCGKECYTSIEVEPNSRISFYMDTNPLMQTNWTYVVNTLYSEFSDAEQIWQNATQVGCAVQRYDHPKSPASHKGGDSYIGKPVVDIDIHEILNYTQRKAKLNLDLKHKHRYRYACLYKD